MTAPLRVAAAAAAMLALALLPTGLPALKNASATPPDPDPPSIERVLEDELAETADGADLDLSAAELAKLPDLVSRFTVSQARAGKMCMGSYVEPHSDDEMKAAEVMAGKLKFGSWPAFDLPDDPTWRENPYSDASWNFRYQALIWLDVLRRQGISTGDQAMLDRWQFLLEDWLADVPPGDGSPRGSWMDMGVGLRAIYLSCAVAQLGPQPWLLQGIATHGLALTDPLQYVSKGNHAMHQNNGLLALGVAAGVPAWRDMSLQRNNKLLLSAVDAQGMTNEGSLGYQWKNYIWWNDAKSRILAAGLPLSRTFARVDKMTDVVTHGTAPDGYPELVGDTLMYRTGFEPGTPSEWAVTQGRSGREPALLTRVFDTAGMAFGRSSWAPEEFADAAFWSMRFGPPVAQQGHGHHDHGSVTFSAYGSRLLWDQGLYAYYGASFRRYVRSAGAHNGVTIPGVPYDTQASAPLIANVDTPEYTLLSADIRSITGYRWIRTLFFSKQGKYLLIDDRVTPLDGNKKREAIQRFHLGADRSVVLRGRSAVTYGPGANLSIFNFGDPPRVVVKGQNSPLMGWRSTAYRQAVPVPVLETRQSGSDDIRFTTVIVPRPDGADNSTVRLAGTSRTDTTAFATVHTPNGSERIAVSTYGATVHPAR